MSTFQDTNSDPNIPLTEVEAARADKAAAQLGQWAPFQRVAKLEAAPTDGALDARVTAIEDAEGAFLKFTVSYPLPAADGVTPVLLYVPVPDGARPVGGRVSAAGYTASQDAINLTVGYDPAGDDEDVFVGIDLLGVSATGITELAPTAWALALTTALDEGEPILITVEGEDASASGGSGVLLIDFVSVVPAP